MPDRLLFMLSKVQTRLTAHMKGELKKAGVALSPGQIGILLVLSAAQTKKKSADKKKLNRNSQVSMGSISQTLDIDNAAITRLVDKLEKQGLVERHINLDDRRQMLISITEQGRESAVVIKKVAKAANQKIKKGFTEQEVDIFKRVNMAILNKF